MIAFNLLKKIESQSCDLKLNFHYAWTHARHNPIMTVNKNYISIRSITREPISFIQLQELPHGINTTAMKEDNESNSVKA